MLQMQQRVYVSIPGVGPGDFGEWMRKGGGETSIDDTKTRLGGGMQNQVSLGGPVSTENVTVSRLFDGFMQGQVHDLRNNVGKVDVTVTEQPTDRNGAPAGRAQIFTGILARVSPPEMDSDSNDLALIEIEVSTNGKVA
jgi:hypothetical protein